MKKMLLPMLAGIMFSFCQAGFCNPLFDQIQTAFVGNAKLATEFTTRGKMQYEFLDNFVEVGSLNGSPIIGIDLGLLGTQLPDSSVKAVDWSNGIKVHLSPILKSYITLQPEWQFINNLEIDGRYSYNWTQHHAQAGLSIAYPFK